MHATRRATAFCLTALVGFLLFVAVAHRQDPPTYTIARLRALIAQHPHAWVGRSVRVHGSMMGPAAYILTAGHSGPAQLLMILRSPQLATPLRAPVDLYLQADGRAPAPAAPGLVVRLQPGRSGLIGDLARLPWLGALFPDPRPIVWRRATTYTVRLVRDPSAPCWGSCYDALLSDMTLPPGP